MKDVRLFAKIENREGVRNLEEIITACDLVVIARGDLGSDMPLWELPAVQKQMIVDGDTGMVVNFSRYPAGFRKPKCRFSCAFGIYIIKGAMVTEHGVFGQGKFIWYPKNCICEQTVTADGDCLFLLVTNRNYRLDFLEDNGYMV
ncbi:MAG: hypothetical protein K5744_07045 [Eubacterium sp.]|nr:hypothetical protein [Eubacterium sp.]